MDEIFGGGNLTGEIVWQRTNARGTEVRWPRIHNTIFDYTGSFPELTFKSLAVKAHKVKLPHTLVTGPDGQKYRTYELTAPGVTPERRKSSNVEGILSWKARTTLGQPSIGHGGLGQVGLNSLAKRRWLAAPTSRDTLHPPRGSDDNGWRRLDGCRSHQPSIQRTHRVQTQKPEALIDRLLEASFQPGDLVADFFCGSGTQMAVAEKLGRKWIGCGPGPVTQFTPPANALLACNAD